MWKTPNGYCWVHPACHEQWLLDDTGLNGGSMPRCAQCGGNPDGQEQAHLIDDQTVWLHHECRREATKGPRIGDWVIMSDGLLTRLTRTLGEVNSWADSDEKKWPIDSRPDPKNPNRIYHPGFGTDFQNKGRFWLNEDGSASPCGGNDSHNVSRDAKLVDTGQIKSGEFSFIKMNNPDLQRGVRFELPCRVYRLTGSDVAACEPTPDAPDNLTDLTAHPTPRMTVTVDTGKDYANHEPLLVISAERPTPDVLERIMSPWLADPPWSKETRIIGYAFGGDFRGWLIPRAGAEAISAGPWVRPGRPHHVSDTLFHCDGGDAVRVCELQSAERCNGFYAHFKTSRQRKFRSYKVDRCSVLAPQNYATDAPHWEVYWFDGDRPCGRWISVNGGRCDDDRIAKIINDTPPDAWLAVVDYWTPRK
jgi:hypothetical protein